VETHFPSHLEWLQLAQSFQSCRSVAPVVASNQGYSGTMGLLNQHHASGRLQKYVLPILQILRRGNWCDEEALHCCGWNLQPIHVLTFAESPTLISAAKKLTIGLLVRLVTPLQLHWFNNLYLWVQIS
jgi:hypothetical protein